MIRSYINGLNERYNSYGNRIKIILLLGFSIGFLALLWLSISLIPFNAKVYQNTRPTHIGRASGPQFTDTLTHQKQ